MIRYFSSIRNQDKACVEQRLSYPFVVLFPFFVLQVIVLLVHIEETMYSPY